MKTFVLIIFLIVVILTALVMGIMLILNKHDRENTKQAFEKHQEELNAKYGSYYDYCVYVAKKYLIGVGVAAVLIILALI